MIDALDYEESFDCELCNDTGVLIQDEDDGNGHTAYGVLSKKCPCQMHEDEWEPDLHD